MATGNTALKEHALATIQAGRREISAEVKWLGHELNPKRIASRVVHNHGTALLVSAFVVGFAGVLYFTHRRSGAEKPRPAPESGREHKKATANAKVGAGVYLLGLALKLATPYVLKHGGEAWLQSLLQRKAGIRPSSSAGVQGPPVTASAPQPAIAP